MKGLIPQINEFQDILLKSNYTNKIQLPQIVVVGNQSSGKSSLLESIIGKDVLPRGSGIVTRRPTIIQLFNIPKEKAEYCEFIHRKGQVFSDYGDVRKEMENEMARVAGINKGISDQPIILRIFSPDVINLSQIDLPGLTKVPIGEQPIDIEDKIRSIVKYYIQNPNTIILCVLPANVDLANSDAQKIAQEVDPHGERTYGVLTKMDLIDQSTAGVEIIEGKVYPLQQGYAGVVLRSAADISRGKSLKESVESEEKYFSNHPSYKTIRQKLGVPNLVYNLNQLLTYKIKQYLPSIKIKLQSLIQHKEEELRNSGESAITDYEKSNKSGLLLNILNKFSTQFNDVINGRNSISATGELFGGARINYIFNDIFIKAINQLDPFEIMSDNDIRAAIRNSNGLSPSLTVSEAAFVILVKEHISRLEEPSLDCATLVYEELKRIVYNLRIPELTRFEALKNAVNTVIEKLQVRCKDPTDTMLRNIIAIELGHINTRHPDFIGGTKEYLGAGNPNGNASKDELEEVPSEKVGGYGGPAISRNDSERRTSNNNSIGGPHRIFENDPGRVNQSFQGALQNNLNSSFQEGYGIGIGNGSKGRPNGTSVHFSYGNHQEQDILGKNYEGGEITNSQGKVPDKIVISNNLSKREKNEINLIKKMIMSYFDVIRKNICDLVPKTVITMLVKQAVATCEKELVQNLYEESKIDELLVENAVVTKKREELRNGVAMLKKCKMVIQNFDQKY